MRKTFVALEQIQYVINGFNKLYKHMTTTGNIETDEMKNFMEPYFKESGYRDNNKKKNLNILIIHDAGVGDFIIMSAAIREIRNIYPDSHITLMVCSNATSMAEYCPYVNKIFVYNESLMEYDNFFQFYKIAIQMAKELLIRRTDIAFNFGHYPCSQLITYMSGAREIVDKNVTKQVPKKATKDSIPINFFSNFCTFRPREFYIENPHDSQFLISFIKQFTKKQIKNKNLEIWLAPSENAMAESALQKFNNKKIYAICMGGASKCKRWSAKKYGELMNMILAESKVGFVIFGGSSEINASNEIKSLVDNDNILDFTNKCNYRQSAAILNLCDCYIGDDTGMMHAAAALKIPVLSPNCFPADMPMTVDSFTQRFYPYNVPSVIVQPEHALPECKNAKISKSITFGCSSEEAHCINQITPEMMLDGLHRLEKRIKQNERVPMFATLK